MTTVARESHAPSRTSATLELGQAETRDLLAAQYGIAAEALTLMQSELSTVYRVDARDGARFAYKATVHSDVEMLAAQWRVEIMAALQNAGVPAGETRVSLAGDAVARVDTSQGPAIMHVGDWLSGTQVADARATPQLMTAIGRTAAQTAAVLGTQPPPPVAIEHPWELVRTVDTIAETLPRVREVEHRALISEARDRFMSHVAPKLSALPHGVVHHDLHDSNLLVDESAARVTGVLDFGDMVWGPRMADLAVTAAYCGRGAPDSVEAFHQIVEAWGSCLPLLEPEAEVVLDAAIARLAVNLSVWSSRRDSARGAYAHSRSATTTRALASLLSVDRSRTVERVQAALVAR